MQVFKDFLSAVHCFTELRKIHKTEEAARMMQAESVRLPERRLALWVWTVEASILFPQKEIETAVKEMFYTLPVETQRALTFFPGNETRAQRLNFWREQLHVLPRKEYYRAMQMLASGYAYGLKRRKSALTPEETSG